MQEGRQFLEALRRRAPAFYAQAARNVGQNEELCAWLLDPLARWSQAAFGPELFDLAAQGYVRYCLDVSRRQRRYERTGVFCEESQGDIEAGVYQNSEYMLPYLWAAVLLYAYWPSMVRHLAVLRQFLVDLPRGARVLEVACGHGVLGLLAAEERLDVSVEGLDLSPSAIVLAQRLLDVSGHAGRVTVSVRDALEKPGEEDRFDGILAAMLAEHLREPGLLFDSLSARLAPGGRCFCSVALESAQRDHVFEFHQESEVVAMAEASGLRAVETLSCGARPDTAAKYRPRAMALLLEHH